MTDQPRVTFTGGVFESQEATPAWEDEDAGVLECTLCHALQPVQVRDVGVQVEAGEMLARWWPLCGTCAPLAEAGDERGLLARVCQEDLDQGWGDWIARSLAASTLVRTLR